MKNHFVEALMLLLKEYSSMGKKERYAYEYKPIEVSLDRLIPIYELTDEDFLHLYAIRYRNDTLSSQRNRYLQNCIDELQDYTSFFSNTLNFKYAILCVKAQQRIASLCKNLDTDTLWVTYLAGIALYARLYDFSQLFVFCNNALKVARERKDASLEFIILVHEWVQCYLATLQDPSLDIDMAQLDVEEQILGLFAPYNNDADSFVQSLKDKEMRILEETGPSRFLACKAHIGLLEESLACYKMMLSQGREDTQAVEYALNQVRKAEKEIYGEESQSDYKQTLSLIGNLQGELSSEQEQIVFRGSMESADPMQVIQEGTDPMERFFKLVFFPRKLTEEGYRDNAVKFYEEAKSLIKGLCDPFLEAMVMLTKARITQEDNAAQAIKEKEEALGLLDKAETEGNTFAMVHYLKYTLHTEMGDLFMQESPQKAIEEFTMAMEQLETISLGQTLRLSQLLNLRSVAYLLANEMDSAEQDLVQSLNIVLHDIRNRLPFMNSEKREMFWKKVSVALQETMTMINSYSSDELRCMAYQVVLLSKGLLLTSEQTVKNLIETDDAMSELRPLYKELQEKEAYKDSTGNEESVVNDYSDQFIQNVRLTQVLNKVISEHCDYLFETYEKVQGRLNKDQILIDYYDYELDDGDQQYVAFIVTLNCPAPIFIKLCKESDLSRLFDEAKKEDDFEAYNPQKRYSYELSKMLWKPIEDYVQVSQNSKIFIVPSGSIAKIPVESLSYEEGKDVILSEYFRKFIRLSHARTLSMHDNSELGSIALFGGLEYGSNSEIKEDSPNLRGYKIDASDVKPTHLEAWKYLEGTNQEVTIIAQKMQKAHKNVKVFKGKDGTVASFKALSGNAPDIIHIASHGFFETQESAIELPALQSDNPMSLSGLVFSNGNEGWLHGTVQNHEGIITAAEIAHLQLPCQLVILSACETGEGVVKSDGVFGLQRGFKKAGVRSLIMSLWDLEDMGEMAFMQMLYIKLIKCSDSHRAFLETKHELKTVFPNLPFLWAGMIMLD